MEAAIAETPRVFNILNPSAVESDLPRCPELELAQRVAGGDMAALEEVARMFGISPGTSKSQLHKARMRLRRMLKP